MFEEKTYENILADMLSRVTNDVDKREGSILYDALAPCAYELAQTYFSLNNFLDLVSGDTAVGEYLDRVVADYGISRKQATKAVRKILTTDNISIGTRWGLSESVYQITASLGENMYQAECEQTGEIGNRYSGTLVSLDNIKGVTATLGDIIIAGEEIETDNNLRARFYAQVQSPSTSGNADNYKRWALEVPGVGDAKVYPLWNGNGTVKVVVVDSDKQPAEPGLIQETTEYIESVRPIGAFVTVVSGTAKLINISAKLTLAPGYSLSGVTNTFIEAVTKYFQSIAFSQTYVSYAKIGTILLGTNGVVDYHDLKLNGTVINVSLDDEEIPSLGTVSLEV